MDYFGGHKLWLSFETIYKTALERIAKLLPMVSDETPTSDRKAIELKIMSDIVIEYEEANLPISNALFLWEPLWTLRALCENLVIRSNKVREVMQSLISQIILK